MKNTVLKTLLCLSFFAVALFFTACAAADNNDAPATKAAQGTFTYAGKTASFSVDIPESRAAAFTGKLEYNGAVAAVKGSVTGTALSFSAASGDVVYQISGTLSGTGALASAKAVLQVKQSDGTWETVSDINVSPADNVKIDKEPAAVSNSIPEQFWGKWQRKVDVASEDTEEAADLAAMFDSVTAYDEMYITGTEIYSQASTAAVMDLEKTINSKLGPDTYAKLSEAQLAGLANEIIKELAAKGYKAAVNGKKLTAAQNTALKYDLSNLSAGGDELKVTLAATVEGISSKVDYTLKVSGTTLSMAMFGSPPAVYNR